MKKIIGLAALLFAIILLSFSHSRALKPDETAIFYPTDAALIDGKWNIPVHGWVFEPEEDSVKRGLLLDLAKKYFGDYLRPEEEALFRKRAIRFLADSEEGKEFSIEVCGSGRVEAASGEGGQMVSSLTVAQKDLCGAENGWLEVKTSGQKGDSRIFSGKIQLVEPEGVSVVSDIDDTIKMSDVKNSEELMKNTFLRPFLAVEGMSAIYRKWEREGARFHYLSASPWQLYEPLSDFLDREKFPRGTFYLKNFRLSPSGLGEISAGPGDYKTKSLTALLERYPHRKFILVGDIGESDPEIYSEIAQKFPSQVALVVIRDDSSILFSKMSKIYGPELAKKMEEKAALRKERHEAAAKKAGEGKYISFTYPYELSGIAVSGGEVGNAEAKVSPEELAAFKTTFEKAVLSSWRGTASLDEKSSKADEEQAVRRVYGTVMGRDFKEALRYFEKLFADYENAFAQTHVYNHTLAYFVQRLAETASGAKQTTAVALKKMIDANEKDISKVLDSEIGIGIYMNTQKVRELPEEFQKMSQKCCGDEGKWFSANMVNIEDTWK